MAIYLTRKTPGGPLRGCPYHNLGCSVVGVTAFHSRRRRRDSSLWPFYSYSRTAGALFHIRRIAPPRLAASTNFLPQKDSRVRTFL